MIDTEALGQKQDKVRVVIEEWDECERHIAYFQLYNLGVRRDGIEREIQQLAPRKGAG